MTAENSMPTYLEHIPNSEVLPTDAQALVTYFWARQKYAAWLRTQPADQFAPASHEEVLALYDRTCSPIMTGGDVRVGSPDFVLTFAIALETISQCGDALEQLATKQNQEEDETGRQILREAVDALTAVVKRHRKQKDVQL